MSERHSGQEAKSSRRVAFVQSCWHKDLVDQIRSTFLAESEQLGIAKSQIDFFEVTGAFEIPLHAMRLAENGAYDAIVAAGLVVDGGIYRHEFVADAVINGLMRVQLDTGVPVISAVLTPTPLPRARDPSRLLLRASGGQGSRGRTGLRSHDRRTRPTASIRLASREFVEEEALSRQAAPSRG